MIKTLVFCLEEESAKVLLEGILPRLLPDNWTFMCIPFKGKQDLEKNLARRMRGWLKPHTQFVVMRDQDAGDCVILKNRLAELCVQAGKPNAMIRIACRELESFYFGNMEAVEKGLQIDNIAKLKTKAKYRNPDRIGNPSEELMKITDGVYQKVSGSRAIAPYLDLELNSSRSFNVLIAGIKRLIAS